MHLRARRASALDFLTHGAESALGIDSTEIAVLEGVEAEALQNFFGSVGLAALRRFGAAHDRCDREEQCDESRRHDEDQGIPS
jgi:hypothetical protein